MVADIAHELRTPLAVIQGNLQALLDDVYPLEKGEVQTILDETLLLARLVEDLRELALAEAGQLRIEAQVVDVAGLLAQASEVFRGLASDKGVALAVSVAESLGPAWADPDRAGQVLHNLLANALRYTPAGGSVTMRALPSTDAAGDPAARASSAPMAVILVEDTGPGIAPADLPHVFERFWRADPARARQQGGSGLGLAIARQLVQAQGGQIGVTSTVGQGSCFWFTLPLCPPEREHHGSTGAPVAGTA
jgi:two-component system OmpR family sensor kinase/two-component system sensor histidine kinase BaeS